MPLGYERILTPPRSSSISIILSTTHFINGKEK
nr:MAG TPA: hypothetical protein [Caudoviricetes sp.]